VKTTKKVVKYFGAEFMTVRVLT